MRYLCVATRQFLRLRMALGASKPHHFALKLCFITRIVYLNFSNFISRNETYTDEIYNFTKRVFVCKIPLLARRTRATIGYLVYKACLYYSAD